MIPLPPLLGLNKQNLSVLPASSLPCNSENLCLQFDMFNFLSWDYLTYFNRFCCQSCVLNNIYLHLQDRDTILGVIVFAKRDFFQRTEVIRQEDMIWYFFFDFHVNR